jgi:hypothetical protein
MKHHWLDAATPRGDGRCSGIEGEVFYYACCATPANVARAFENDDTVPGGVKRPGRTKASYSCSDYSDPHP